MYECVMVVTHLYTCIGTEIERYGGTEIERYGDEEKQYIPMPICLDCLEFVACRFTLVRFGCQIDWFRF